MLYLSRLVDNLTKVNTWKVLGEKFNELIKDIFSICNCKSIYGNPIFIHLIEPIFLPKPVKCKIEIGNGNGLTLSKYLNFVFHAKCYHPITR